MHCQEGFLMLSGAQLRAARALINWSASEVAEKCSSTRNTIERLEKSDGIPSSKIQTLLMIKKTFEEAGVEFIGSPDNGPGVRLKPKE